MCALSDTGSLQLMVPSSTQLVSHPASAESVSEQIRLRILHHGIPLRGGWAWHVSVLGLYRFALLWR